MEDINLQPASGYVGASGDQSQILSAATAPSIRYIHGWNMSITGSATAMLFEYGTGSRALDILLNKGGATTDFGSNQSSQDLVSPFGVGAGSSIYLTVDGLAQASATVFYSQRD